MRPGFSLVPRSPQAMRSRHSGPSTLGPAGCRDRHKQCDPDIRDLPPVNADQHRQSCFVVIPKTPISANACTGISQRLSTSAELLVVIPKTPISANVCTGISISTSSFETGRTRQQTKPGHSPQQTTRIATSNADQHGRNCL